MNEALDLILAAALIILAGAGVWVAIRAVATLRSVEALATSLDDRLPQLIKKASDAVDSVNKELERVDSVVTQIEEVSDTVAATTRVARDAVRTPLAKLAGVGGGVRGVLASMRRK